MHQNNRRWLTELSLERPGWFDGTRVLEIGAAGADPFIRDLFTTDDYTGIDIVPGPNVDLVADAKFHKHDLSYDVIMCFSVLEHDPGWETIMENAYDLMHPGSMMIGCHGAEGNLHHGPEPWAIVSARNFLFAVTDIGFVVIESFFEEERYGPDCAGAYDWILTKPRV